MNRLYTLGAAVVLILNVPHLGAEASDDRPVAASKILLDAAGNAGTQMTPTSAQVAVARSQDAAAPGVVVTIQPGKEGYPGVRLKPEGAEAWNLAAFGHVDARVVNTSQQPISLALRIDNEGDWHNNPWNTEHVKIQPGDAATITTIFGYSYGRKPGFALNPAAVVQVLLFVEKSESVQSFRIESIAAAGPAGEKPPVDPNSIRVRPKHGALLGKDASLDPARQFVAKGAARATLISEGHAVPSLRATFTPSKAERSVSLKPAAGRWDLHDCLEVRVSVVNVGATPVTPRVRVESNGGPSDWIPADKRLLPNQEATIVVPFAGLVPWQAVKKSGDRMSWNGQPGTGSRITSDAVAAVNVSVDQADDDADLRIQSIVAGVPPVAEMPKGLGKRPPVEGDWVLTFDEQFDGTAVDLSKWNNEGPNYWDKTSRWSKSNVIVADGVARMHYEKKTGHNNDDPKQKRADYTGGYLDTLGKFTQRYGYFEARMKLPTAPGLWPAFWMMPDRGVGVPKRQDTGDGGMEFDIMEHLTRWGPYRYNIAMHWDGYGKEHKSVGTSNIYVQTDKDGYLTSGLLWTPGLLVFYGNGREVARWEDPRVASVPAYMMFTLPAGGWDNSRLEDSRLPDDFVIDYVRAWQRRDLASPSDGKQPANPKAQ